MKKKRECEF